MSSETQPVAWRVKDYADGWSLCQPETAAKLLADRTGALIEPLYSADAIASRDAEIERLSAALGEAERAINRAKEAVEDQDDIELVGSLDAALSTLKTAREGDNA